jgi:DNA-binding NarL/FixJ family response regulator
MIVVAHARNYSEALAAFRSQKPDITLMDIRLAGDNGIDAMIRIRQEFPQAKVMMLTTFENDVQRALKAGAVAYVLKSAPQSEVFDAIRRVYAGKKYLSPEVAALLAECMADEGLTARELQVLTLIQHGLRTKQIAAELIIGEATVTFHIKNLMSKLQANDRAHALSIALKRGLLEL